MEGLTCQLLLFSIFAPGMAFHIAGLDQFFFDLGQVSFGLGQVQSRTDRVQMLHFIMGFFRQGGQGFKGPF